VFVFVFRKQKVPAINDFAAYIIARLRNDLYCFGCMGSRVLWDLWDSLTRWT